MAAVETRERRTPRVCTHTPVIDNPRKFCQTDPNLRTFTTTLLALALLSGAAPTAAQRMYDSSGGQIGRVDGERYYDSSGRQIGRVDGTRIYDASGRQLGRIDGDRVYDSSGSHTDASLDDEIIAEVAANFACLRW